MNATLPTSLAISLATFAVLANDCDPEPVPVELNDCSDQTRVFFAWDLAVMPPRTIEVPATCRLVGPNAYLYVADDQWGTNVNEEIALSFMETMEIYAGPDAMDPTTGMIGNNRQVFGEFPDELDDDPRIYLLLLDLADFVASDGDVFGFDGYFNAYDQLPDEQVSRATLGLYRSNEVEMLYMNSRIRPADDLYTLAVASHEMQHLIAWNYDSSEEIWMSESLAEVAMLVNGYYTDVGWVEHYASKPYYPLVNNTSSGSYGSYLLFGMYLFERFGDGFMLPLESQPQDGITGLNRALAVEGYGEDFTELFGDWIVANAVNDATLEDGRFAYAFTEALPEFFRSATLSRGESAQAALKPTGVAYFDVSAGPGARVVDVVADGDLMVRAVVTDASGATAVLRVTDGERSAAFDLAAGASALVVVSSMQLDEVDTGLAITADVAVEAL